ncbi:hypothetical protein AB9D36_27800 [Klebsiella pneumoniae]|uniref:hypothetical protein n=1 Tax=Klebsiella pneumoniae TaxID=573 RepID=UPI00350F2530
MKIKPVNLNKTLKLLEGTEAEKPFIEDMLLYMDQAKEYEEKNVLQSNLYEELNSSLVYRYKTIVNNAPREDLSIIAISGEEIIGSNVDVFLENTAVRFKVRDKLNESGYSVAVKVKDGKTVLDVDMKQAGFTALKTLSNELEELKPWVNDYIATLKEQVSDSVQAQALPDTIEPYKTSWVELPEERRILVKVHANPNYVIESTQSNGDNTVRGFRGKRPVIANNIHVAQDASVHGQLYEFVYDVSDAKYVLCDDAKREELKKLGREDQITYFPNDERAFVPEHGGVFPFAKWMNSRTDLKSDTYREIVLKHVNRELEKAGYGDYPVHSFVSRVQKFKDEEQAEAVRKVHTDLPQSINDYKEEFAELAKLNIDPNQKNASIINKYNINIREKSKRAIELTTELERMHKDIEIMKLAQAAEVENLTLKVEKDKLSSKVIELTEQTSLKDEEINELKEELEKERTEKEEFVDKNNELYFKNTELEKEKEELAKEVSSETF